MSLRKSRKALSVILAVVIVIGGNLFFSSLLIKNTICNQKYLERVVFTQSFTEECEQNFNAYTQALSAQSGIPAQVFAVTVDRDRVNDRIMSALFGNNGDLYIEDMTDKFKELCIEYFDGNQIEYDDAILENTAEAAANAYESCFGITNVQSVQAFITHVNHDYGKYTSIGLLLIVVSAFLLFLLFSKRSDFAKAFYSGFTALGASMFFIGLAGLVFHVGGSPNIAPALYADVFAKAVNGPFIINLAVGVVIAALSIVGLLCRYEFIKKK